MTTTTASPTASILTAVALVLAVIAIVRSPRKLHTTLYILGAVFVCILVGAGIGLALGSAAGAGTLAAIASQLGGIAVSIEQIRRYRKIGPKYPVKPL